MLPLSATSIASPNIALIKYWGNRQEALRIPANDSLSLTLSGIETRTRVQFTGTPGPDRLVLNGLTAGQAATQRAARMLDDIRRLAGLDSAAEIDSQNNFPTGAGIASSASGYAALAHAASRAAGLELDGPALSRLARLGSGSAARSVFGGFVRLHSGEQDSAAFAEQVFPADHWPLVDVIAVVAQGEKSTGSTRGHQLASSSPLQAARVADAPRRLDLALNAIGRRDFEALAAISELDSNMMHAVMLTSDPPLLYWAPASIEIMLQVQFLRGNGDPVFYTVDAGPNVHCLTLPDFAASLRARLTEMEHVRQVLVAPAGDGARVAAP